MKHTFYPGIRSVAATCLLLVLCACGGQPEPPAPNGNQTASQGPFHVSQPRIYERVAADQLLARHIEKLRSGSRDGLRFAKQVIGSYGDAAVPALLEGLSLELEKDATNATNFLSALSYTKTQQQLPILLDVLARHSSPLVRSQAVDTIGLLKQQSLLPGLLEHAERETEDGPLVRMLPCMGALGGEEAAQYLAQIISSWLQQSKTIGSPAAAWDSLLEMEGSDALPWIAELESQVPLLMQQAGWVRLLEGGKTEWLEKVRTLVDPKVLGKASLRGRVVVLLCELGEWDSVAIAGSDPNGAVRAAYINALRLKEEAWTDAEQAHVVAIAASPSKDEAYPALRALLSRGEAVHLEQWLGQVKGYPTRAGSIDALHLFMQEGITHPRLVPLMIERWPYCEVDFRIDITRVMAKHPTEQALAYLESVVVSTEEDPEVRLSALRSLGNSGEACLPALFRIWDQKPSPATSDRLFSALLRYPDHAEVREFCASVIVDADVPDFAKAQLLIKLPVAYREDAYPMLLQARDATDRPEIHQYVDSILLEYF